MKRVAQTAEMRDLRSIAAITLRKHRKSKDIRELCSMYDIFRWPRNRHPRWSDHVERMDGGRLTKIAKPPDAIAQMLEHIIAATTITYKYKAAAYKTKKKDFFLPPQNEYGTIQQVHAQLTAVTTF